MSLLSVGPDEACDGPVKGLADGGCLSAESWAGLGNVLVAVTAPASGACDSDASGSFCDAPGVPAAAGWAGTVTGRSALAASPSLLARP
jgi:hypothetical protein